MRKRFANLKYQEKVFLKLLKKFTAPDKRQIVKAWEMAKTEHLHQKRSSGLPYIIHPLRMSNYLVKKLKILDADFVAATLLHDTVEDGTINVQKITEEFNQTVASLVNGLTRPAPPQETEAQKRINKVKKFQELLQNGQDALLIKAIDLLDNLTSWQYIAPGHPDVQKFPRWFAEAREYYLQIAQKAHPQIYRDMQRAVPKTIKKIQRIHHLI